jgi:nucleotide-binding universal stress UspA family protein
VAGTPASRTAQEVAYALARATGTEVVLTHVVSRPEPALDAYPTEPGRQPARAAALASAAESIVESAAAHAREHDVEALTNVRTGTATGEEILTAARAAHADLVVLGTTIRRIDERSFLGHTVEYVIDNAEQPVVVVATPDTLLAEGIAERAD